MFYPETLSALERIAIIPKRTFGPGQRSSGLNRNYTRHHFPHSSSGEQARRLRQEIRALAKRAIEYDTSGTFGWSFSVWDQLVASPEEYQKFRKASVPRLLSVRNNLLADLKS